MKEINFVTIFRRIWAEKKIYMMVLLSTFVVSCAIILPLPRTYDVSISMAPEAETGGLGSSLSSIANSLGFDIGSIASADAIYPDLYPELLHSSDFLVGLFDVHVENEDKSIDTNYYTYMDKLQKRSVWKVIGDGCVALVEKMMPAPDLPGAQQAGFDPFRLNRHQTAVVKTMRKNIACDIDKKTGMITLTYTDQDRLIAACMADSIKEHLQQAIVEYRTRKARIDLEYYQKLEAQAEAEYQEAIKRYGHFADTHKNTASQLYRSETERLANEVDRKQQAYSALAVQVQAAEARILANTPAFTTLQGATIPIKPTGPKRMLFVAGMMLLSLVVTSVVRMRDLYI